MSTTNKQRTVGIVAAFGSGGTTDFNASVGAFDVASANGTLGAAGQFSLTSPLFAAVGQSVSLSEAHNSDGSIFVKIMAAVYYYNLRVKNVRPVMAYCFFLLTKNADGSASASVLVLDLTQTKTLDSITATPMKKGNLTIA